MKSLKRMALAVCAMGTVFGVASPMAFANTTHTVQSGETLWNIAQVSGTSVSAIEAANPSVQANNLLIGTALNLPSTTYSIQSGDSLWKIASALGTSVSTLQYLNPTIDPNNLLIGETIQVPASSWTTAPSTQATTPTSTPTSVSASDASSGTSRSSLVARILATANGLLGTPYVWGGSTPSGFDCSGFVQYVFAQNGIQLPRVSRDQYTVGTPIAKSDLQPGDLVFFSDTWRAGVSHVGIYVGNGQFIEESSGAGKVVVKALSNVYYAAHYTGAKRDF